MLTHSDKISLLLQKRDLASVTAAELWPPDGDAEEILSNGNFESWSSATDADDWTEGVEGTGSHNRESTEQRSGTYCYRADKTSAGNLSLVQAPLGVMVPGKWYNLTGWYKADATGVAACDPASPVRLFVIKTTEGNRYLQFASGGNGGYFPLVDADGKNTWDVAASWLILLPTEEWRQFSVWFRYATNDEDSSFGASGNIYFGHSPIPGSGSYYLDDVSIRGPFSRPALFYSSKNFTFGGNQYTSRLLKVEKSRDSVPKIVQSKCEIVLGNADRALRRYYEPTDLFDGGRIYLRHVYLDPSNDYAPDETGQEDRLGQVYWQGVMRRGKLGDDLTITVPAVWRLAPNKQLIPIQKTTPYCQVRTFGDGVDCNYTTASTATTNANTAASAPSTGPINVGDSSDFTVGDRILLRNGALDIGGVVATVATIPGGTSITVEEAIHWRSGWDVFLKDCDREYPRCQTRGRTHENQGCRAVLNLRRQVQRGRFFFGGGAVLSIPQLLSQGFDNFKASSIYISQTEFLADASTVVPFITGRRWVQGRVVEKVQSADATGTQLLDGVFEILAQGEISNVHAGMIDDADYAHVTEGSGISHGWYWRPGTLGVTGIESVADYQADPMTQKRDQNRDYMTVTGGTYSRFAYVIAITGADDDEDGGDVARAWDVSGALLQAYTAAGAADGSPAWTANPFWAMIWLCSTPRFALDLSAADDFDYAVIRPEADHCDTTLTSTLAVATTTGSGGTGTDIDVDSVEGFYRGQTIDVGGDTGVTIAKILGPDKIRLTSSITWAASEVVQGYVSQWETHYWSEDKQEEAIKVLEKYREACRGIVTQDHGTGKLRLYSERAHVTNLLTNGDFSDWTGSNPDGWTLNVISNTVEEETTIVRSGSSLQANVTANETSWVSQTATGLTPGAWYLMGGWFRFGNSTGWGFTDGLRLRVRNTTAGTSYDPATGWQSGTAYYLLQGWPVRIDEWIRVVRAFQVPNDYNGTDTLQFEFHFNGPTDRDNFEVYMDDLEVTGPLDGYFRDTDDDWPKATVTQLTNGSLDTWGLGNPTNWFVTGTVDEETTIVKTAGGSSARLDGDTSEVTLQFADVLPSRRYMVQFWAYVPTSVSDTDAASCCAVRVYDWTSSKYLGVDGTWSAGVKYAYQPGVLIKPEKRGTWQFYSFEFTPESSHEPWDGVDITWVGAPSGEYLYLDDVDIYGPIDRVPLVQPGMGILKGSVRPLNQDDERKGANQTAVEFTSEDLGGQTDEAIYNDFDAQKTQRQVRPMKITMDAIGHKDHARRMAEFMQKKAAAAPGLRVAVAWYGILTEPGRCVAIRFEDQYHGAVKRITRKEVAGLGSPAENTTGLELEDYDATIYSNSPGLPGSAATQTLPSLTLVVDNKVTLGGKAVASIKGVRLTWSWDGPVYSVAKFTIHAATSSGFTPSSANKIGSTIGVKKFTWDPPDELDQTTLYFIVVAHLSDWSAIQSSEDSIFISQVVETELDGTSLTQTQPFNLVYDGDFNDPTEWENNHSVTTSAENPTGDADGGGDQAWSNRNQGRDGSGGTATTASVMWDVLPPTVEEAIAIYDWGSSVAGNVSGQLYFKEVRITNETLPPSLSATIKMEMSTDGGATYPDLVAVYESASGDQLASFYGPVLVLQDITDVKAKITARARAYGIADRTYDATMTDVWFDKWTATSMVARVSGGTVMLKSDGVDDAYVARPFPGESAAFTTPFITGEKAIIRLKVRTPTGASAANGDVVVALRQDGDASTDVAILTIPQGDIEIGTWHDYVNEYEAAGNLAGNFDIVVKTSSTNYVEVDQLGVQEGSVLTKYMLSIGEVLSGLLPSKTNGVTQSPPPGAWTSTPKKVDVA